MQWKNSVLLVYYSYIDLLLLLSADIMPHTPCFPTRMEGYRKEEREEAIKSVPLIFIASPSAKDPTWEQRKPGRVPVQEDR